MNQRGIVQRKGQGMRVVQTSTPGNGLLALGCGLAGTTKNKQIPRQIGQRDGSHIEGGHGRQKVVGLGLVNAEHALEMRGSSGQLSELVQRKPHRAVADQQPGRKRPLFAEAQQLGSDPTHLRVFSARLMIRAESA